MSMHMDAYKRKQHSLRGKMRIIAGAVQENKEEIETVGKRWGIKTNGRESQAQCNRHCKQPNI